MAKSGSERVQGYHAHVYYNGETRDAAARLREAVDAEFKVTLGRWREQPVGPHPQSMYQVAFDTDVFADLVPWLMLHRDGLDILVHPLTDDARADHLDYALWLGDKLALRRDVLEKIANSE